MVWIDGGLHATETLGAQQLAEMVYQMVSRTDAETMRFLDECIILFVHANPDGNDLVADWYMRNPDPLKRSAAGLPRLYQKYIGHDNNRDFFASTQAETENINRVLYHEWLPQILYNHHQSGPAGTVVWSSPQRDPYNYNLDPLLILGLQALGTHMHQRLAAEGKPGATMASGGAYDGWWNGGIRNTGNFHNIIAILTETIGSPTPMRIPLVIERQIPEPRSALPDRAAGVAVQAVDRLFDLVQPRGDRLRGAQPRAPALQHLRDGAAGDRARQRGHVDALADAAAAGSRSGWAAAAAAGRPERDAELWAELRKPERPRSARLHHPVGPAGFPHGDQVRQRAARGQRRPCTARRASSPSPARRYPAGSFVVMTAQAFRPHVLDMFEPQDHPNVIPYPGAPPTPPYDNAGWTLAFQMGVAVRSRARAVLRTVRARDRLERRAAAGPRDGRGRHHRYRIDRANQRRVSRREPPAAPSARRSPRLPDAFYVAASAANRRDAAKRRGGSRRRRPGSSRARSPAAQAVRAPRIGLWDQYGGSMESGWTRWILEQFEFPFERVFAPQAGRGQPQRRLRCAHLPQRRQFPRRQPADGAGAAALAREPPMPQARFLQDSAPSWAA